MSPHALRQRMKHGNVYPPERAPGRPRAVLHRGEPDGAPRARACASSRGASRASSRAPSPASRCRSSPSACWCWSTGSPPSMPRRSGARRSSRRAIHAALVAVVVETPGVEQPAVRPERATSRRPSTTPWTSGRRSSGSRRPTSRPASRARRTGRRADARRRPAPRGHRPAPRCASASLVERDPRAPAGRRGPRGRRAVASGRRLTAPASRSRASGRPARRSALRIKAEEPAPDRATAADQVEELGPLEREQRPVRDRGDRRRAADAAQKPQLPEERVRPEGPDSRSPLVVPPLRDRERPFLDEVEPIRRLALADDRLARDDRDRPEPAQGCLERRRVDAGKSGPRLTRIRVSSAAVGARVEARRSGPDRGRPQQAAARSPGQGSRCRTGRPAPAAGATRRPRRASRQSSGARSPGRAWRRAGSAGGSS